MSEVSGDTRGALCARFVRTAGPGQYDCQPSRGPAQRVQTDGFRLEDELCFVDEGYSGSTLLRPALERLRDVAAAGGLERLYVHSPDRLARKYAYQVLLVDELRRSGVELVFLNRQIGTSPEEDLLLQVQGMVAEYERAKILERSRRGKRHAARRGSVNVLSGAPYGYRYIGRREAGGAAHLRNCARRGPGCAADLRSDRSPTAQLGRGVPAPAAGRDSIAARQTLLGPQHGVGTAAESGVQGLGRLWQDTHRGTASAFASAAAPVGATPTGLRRL